SGRSYEYDSMRQRGSVTSVGKGVATVACWRSPSARAISSARMPGPERFCPSGSCVITSTRGEADPSPPSFMADVFDGSWLRGRVYPGGIWGLGDWGIWLGWELRSKSANPQILKSPNPQLSPPLHIQSLEIRRALDHCLPSARGLLLLDEVVLQAAV